MATSTASVLPLVTERLRLRALREEDLEALWQLYSHPRVAQFIGAHTRTEVELSYDLHPDLWGSGLATEAATAVMAVAHGPLAIDRVLAVVKPTNTASRRVLEKAGLTHIGERAAYGEDLLLYESVSADRLNP
jgi:RimJ/RimL family protein N-acetyltransferase